MTDLLLSASACRSGHISNCFCPHFPKTYTYICIYMRFITGFDLKGYRSQEFLQSAICKLENQKIQLHNSVRVQRHENKEVQGARAEDGCPNSRRENSAFCPPQIGFYSPILVNVDLLSQATESKSLSETSTQTLDVSS